MGKTTIEWTEATWNPVTGCTKVSEGCKNCYAERVFPRPYSKYCKCGHLDKEHAAPFGAELRGPCTRRCGCVDFRSREFTDVWTHIDRLEQPLHWREPRRIFVNSMSDLFHENVPLEFIDKVFAVMALCPHHTFQILTKRPERMRGYLERTNANMILVTAWNRFKGAMPNTRPLPTGIPWPLPNVWLGVSAEDQKTADHRIPLLLRTPAAIRFVSYEPALGPLSLERWTDTGLECSGCDWGGAESAASPDSVDDDYGFLCPECGETCAHTPLDELLGAGLHWVIVGGESGPGARPFNINWARQVIRQCEVAGVACFVKQLGAKPYACRESTKGKPDHQGCIAEGLEDMQDSKGGDMAEWPEDIRVREYPQT